MSTKRSEIWMHFETLLDNKDKAKCNYCKQILSISCGSVGNLSRHLKKIHPTIPIKRSAVVLCSADTNKPSTSSQSGENYATCEGK